jgi:peptidoglycan hydrolase-like protein with peptidoglycan-binding domain
MSIAAAKIKADINNHTNGLLNPAKLSEKVPKPNNGIKTIIIREVTGWGKIFKLQPARANIRMNNIFACWIGTHINSNNERRFIPINNNPDVVTTTSYWLDLKLY